jgi:YD repeat-containing protein
VLGRHEFALKKIACLESDFPEDSRHQGRNVMPRITKVAFAALAVGLIGSVASSAETITYTYDARGRLVKVVHAGTVNNNNQVCYKLDKAGNRINVKVTTVSTPPACP